MSSQGRVQAPLSEPRRWHRWVVWDVPLGGILSPRPVVYTMTRRGAEQFVERFDRSHHDTGCCPDCSSLWSYQWGAYRHRRATGDKR